MWRMFGREDYAYSCDDDEEDEAEDENEDEAGDEDDEEAADSDDYDDATASDDDVNTNGKHSQQQKAQPLPPAAAGPAVAWRP